MESSIVDICKLPERLKGLRGAYGGTRVSGIGLGIESLKLLNSWLSGLFSR